MICQSTLRKIIGSYSLRPIPRSDQAFLFSACSASLFVFPDLIILRLIKIRLLPCFCVETSRPDIRQQYRWEYVLNELPSQFYYVLSAGPRRSESILSRSFSLFLFRIPDQFLGESRLYTQRYVFVLVTPFQAPVERGVLRTRISVGYRRSFPQYEQLFLCIPVLTSSFVQNLDLPILFFGVFKIHTEKITRKNSSLISPSAGSDFQKDIKLIIRILRQ